MEQAPDEPDPYVHHFAHIRVMELIRQLNAIDADNCDLPLGYGTEEPKSDVPE